MAKKKHKYIEFHRFSQKNKQIEILYYLLTSRMYKIILKGELSITKRQKE